MRHTAALALSAMLAFAPTFASAETKNFSDAEKTAIQDIVKQYLTKDHPEVLVQGLQEMQRRDQASADEKSRDAVKNFKDKLYNDPTTPVGGNPKGDVSIVEFFDFQCGYCKMSEEAVEKLLKEDSKVKIYYKNFPILGPMSKQASKAALASVSQGKYVKFHNAIMTKKEHFTKDEDIFTLAKEVGLDVEKLKKDMEDEKIEKMIAANLELGNSIGVRGTPMFIINDKTFPGAMQYDQMKQAIEEARKTAKK